MIFLDNLIIQVTPKQTAPILSVKQLKMNHLPLFSKKIQKKHS